MKRINLFGILLLVVVICLTSCSKTGPAGPQGERGPQGEQGLQGVPGADGSMIYSDKGIPAADVGKVGDYYLDKSTGDLYGPKTENGWGNPINLKGLKGDEGDSGQDGKDGSQFLSGTTAPSLATGKKGDYFLDESTFKLYGPKTTSGWGNGIVLRGPKGDKGEKGDPGTANVISSGWLGVNSPNDWVQMMGNNTKFALFSEPGDFFLMVDYYNPFRIDAKNTGGAILVYVQLPSNTIRLCPFEYKSPPVAAPPPFPLKMKFRFVIQKSGDDYLLYRVVALRESALKTDFWSTVFYGGFSWKFVIIPPSHARKSTFPPDPKNYKATCEYYGILE